MVFNPPVVETRASEARDLVYATNALPGTLTLKEVYHWFRTQPSVQSLGVDLGEGVFGLITRTHLNQLLVNYLGDHSFLSEPLYSHVVEEPLVVRPELTIAEVVAKLLAQKGQDPSFYDDILVVADGVFIGLISVRDVLSEHIESLLHRCAAVEAQMLAISRKNKELFDDSFRRGTMEMKFRAFFNLGPVPVVVFDRKGRSVHANDRFVKLSAVPAAQIDQGVSFSTLFANDFAGLFREACDRYRVDPSDDLITSLRILPQSGPSLMVDALVSITPDQNHLMVSVMGTSDFVGEEEPVPQTENREMSVYEAPAAPLPTETMQETVQGRRPGRITQAIQTRLTNPAAQGVARSVAAHLIDKEEQLDRMMRKLEKIISVAGQVEEIAAPLVRSSTPSVERKSMDGDLAEFSAIDFSQILIQGNKTGHLMLFRKGDEFPAADVFFEEGRIIHATAIDGLSGMFALRFAMSIREGKFNFIFDELPAERSLQGDGMGLLMEACRQVDEEMA